MKKTDSELERLIHFFNRISGVGRRSAERYVYSILDWDEKTQQDFGKALLGIKQNVLFCKDCGALLTDTDCKYCNNSKRDTQTICVVEHFSQIDIIEKSGSYNGLYHVLGGHLQPLENKGPEQLQIASLLKRLENHVTKEVILALNFNIEGEATAVYLTQEMASFQVQITRLASGIPAGADLNYTDSATMALAISRRRDF